MKLSDWLDQQEPKMSATAFAKRVGLDVSTITRAMNGERRPEWPTLDKIFAATEGAVTPNDFIPETADEAEQRAVN
jgi:transcriptional regulator with XRE-family HTH domain